jgi:hypothetical protein
LEIEKAALAEGGSEARLNAERSLAEQRKRLRSQGMGLAGASGAELKAELDKNKCIVAFVLPSGLAKLVSSMLDPPAAAAGENPPLLDGLGWASLAAGSLVVLITFFTSYSHVDLFGVFQFKVNQQIGIPLLLAAMAALFGEVKLASNDRCANQNSRMREERAREQEERAREREARERVREA